MKLLKYGILILLIGVIWAIICHLLNLPTWASFIIGIVIGQITGVLLIEYTDILD